MFVKGYCKLPRQRCIHTFPFYGVGMSHLCSMSVWTGTLMVGCALWSMEGGKWCWWEGDKLGRLVKWVPLKDAVDSS